MIAVDSLTHKTDVFYPSSDGEPLAETYDHVYVLMATMLVLKEYLKDRKATVLADQFMYYAAGFPKLRVAPDVMVIFDVEPGGRDNYKIWEEGQVPAVIFEMTSPSTKEQDQTVKKNLYESLEVKEYWLFDPKGQWITEQLRGYRLVGDSYQLITDNRSETLGLRLQVSGKIIDFYREDNGQKLLIPDELYAALQEATLARIEAEQRVETEKQRAETEKQRAETEKQRAETEKQRAETEKQ
ncbi:Uma2 family endonuclease, partial [Limnospira platensis]|uniref:Uma2 family endonuclease n=1 Tax=Limnospira platensis TaxID=118562 RepID=UPI00396CEEBD